MLPMKICVVVAMKLSNIEVLYEYEKDSRGVSLESNICGVHQTK